MNKRFFLTLILVLILILIMAFPFTIRVGYAGNHQSNDRLNLLTYNTGLAFSYVPFAKERTPFIINDIKKSSADVVCLQEVWDDKTRTLFIDKLRDVYPYHHLAPIEQKYYKRGMLQAACNIGDLFGKEKFLTCMLNLCKGLSDDEHTQCLMTRCRSAMDKLLLANRQCASALFAQVGKKTLVGIWNVLNPFTQVELFSYGGSTGTILLSKYPMMESERGHLDLKHLSTLTHRGALYATLKISGEEHLISCAHLTADLASSVPYAGEHNSWENENFKQVRELLDFIDTLARGRPSYLMGDFNCSIANPLFGPSCRQIIDDDYTDAVSMKKSFCTYCPSQNSLILNKKEADVAIDHIFIKNSYPLETQETSRVFDELITIEGVTKMQHKSDHFALMISIPLSVR